MHAHAIVSPPARRPQLRAAIRPAWIRASRALVFLYLRLCRQLGPVDRCTGRYY